MAKYAMVIDLQRCIGCSACIIACKNENNISKDIYWCDSQTETKGSFPNLEYEYKTTMCNHCEDAPCINACPTEAMYRNQDTDIILCNHQECIKCQKCVIACPYDEITFNQASSTSEQGLIEKCTFCFHKGVKNLAPACVKKCPTNALIFGDLEDEDSQVSKITKKYNYTVRKKELATKPKVYYINRF